MPPPLLHIVQAESQEKAAKQALLATTTDFFSRFSSDRVEYQPAGTASIQNKEKSNDNSNDPLNIRFDISLRLPDQLPAAQQSTNSQPNVTLSLLGQLWGQQESRTTPGIPANVADQAWTGSTQPGMAIPMLQSSGFPRALDSVSAMGEIGPGDNDTPPPLPGAITLDCETTPNHWLTDVEKQSLGWFSNVNWSDDDNDGWSIAGTPTTSATADPSAVYTPDKNDSFIQGGDPDLRRFVVTVIAPGLQNYDYSFTLTFGTNVRVYLENTKAGPITSGKVFDTSELSYIVPGVSIKSKTLWLEGNTASTAFKDVTLKAEYTPAANTIPIPMLKTTDEAKVTVFGVTETGKFGGSQVEANNKQQPDDPILHSTTAPKGSKDENGQISWDLAKYINLKATTGIDYCAFFHDCMEMQGTVSPPRDANPSIYYGTVTHAEDPSIPEPPPGTPPVFPPPPAGSVTFEQHRDAYIAAWYKSEGGAWMPKSLPSGYQPRVWTDDWSHSNIISTQANIVTATSSRSHIYFIDSPGYDHKDHPGGLDYLMFYANLRNAAFIKFYGGTFQVSDWAKWHSKIDLIPKDSDTLTRSPNAGSQDFGSGWISVPTNIT